ncbi:MAG: prolipoprotein diacylglyceryl transferase [Treponema sp.]|jgi:phosphatidylglycerol:prolipoprotein diacylglycerol transferase|nr:prolipoprotein diacylglyceryl transferase [Treponema sp.]
MLLTIPFPSWLSPEIIPGLPFRWYGLMYLLAFGTAFLLYRRQVRERHFPMGEEELSGLFFWGILALLMGARLVATLVYETSNIYLRRPYLIFWPFRDGKFTGLQGMSYHGGVIGGIAAILLYSRFKRFDYREIGDMFAASIPLGYTFGRLGNFINAELYGRVNTGPLGMVFPHAQELSASEPWVRDAAERAGISLSGAMVNLPRHPSQLYEALFEGVILWLIIWFWRDKKPFKGFLLCLYLWGYGLFRFFIEYFREPDADLGYRIELVPHNIPVALGHPWSSFSTGQIFCFLMILLGVLWFIIASRLPDREPVRLYPDSGALPPGISPGEKESARKRRRRLRKKLQG